MTSTRRPLLTEVIDLERRSVRGLECAGCQQKSFPQREFCPLCGSDDVTAITFAPGGRVVSWTVVHQAPPHLPTPYTLATVDLEDGVRLLGYADDDIDIDDAVTLDVSSHRTDDNGIELWWYRFHKTSEDPE